MNPSRVGPCFPRDPRAQGARPHAAIGETPCTRKLIWVGAGVSALVTRHPVRNRASERRRRSASPADTSSTNSSPIVRQQGARTGRPEAGESVGPVRRPGQPAVGLGQWDGRVDASTPAGRTAVRRTRCCSVGTPGGAPTGQVFNDTSDIQGRRHARHASSSPASTATSRHGTAAPTRCKTAHTQERRLQGPRARRIARGPRLLAANFHDNRIDVFNGKFKLLQHAGPVPRSETAQAVTHRSTWP